MTTTPQDPQDEYRQVYEAICAIAAHCDGAKEKDTVGFNGQDTKFGRRIASVPFEDWTPAVKHEAARILLTYRKQAFTYTGIDAESLSVVQDAQGDTNHVARNDARGYERQAEGASLKNDRKAVLNADGTLSLTWHKKDPDCFGVLLTEVRDLPGRRWTGSANVVDFTPEAVDFIERHCIDAPFDLEIAKAEAVAVEAAKPVVYNVRPAESDDKVKIYFDYNPSAVAAVRDLPGRAYRDQGVGNKFNYADAHPAVLAFAAKFGFTVDPAVEANIKARAEAAGETQEVENVLLTVSRLADPAALPQGFLEQVLARCPNARLVNKEAS